jgi:diguanylate cyclase (GGDEF)-like protein
VIIWPCSEEDRVGDNGAPHQQVLDLADVGFGLTDDNGKLRWVNHALATMLGLPAEQAVGHSLHALLPGVPETVGPDLTVVSPAVEEHKHLWLEISCSRMGDDLLYRAIDVTKWRDRELAVAQQTYALRRAQVLGRMGNWEWFIEDDRVVWSDALIEMFGRTSGIQLDFAAYAEHVHPADLPKLESAIRRAIRTGDRFHYVHRVAMPDGISERVFECFGEVLRDEHGQPVRLLGTAHDITQVHHVQTELRKMAEEDPLTGLPNRRALTRELERHLAAGDRGALLLLDLDNFKDVNDLRGHAVGDRVMRRLAAALRGELTEGNMIGRLGGDEFAVVLPDADNVEAELMARKLAGAVESLPVVAGAASSRMTASVGIAPFSSGEGWESVLANADLALYASKNAGRNRVTAYDPGHYADTAKRVSLLDRVRFALERGGFTLHAMPMVNLPTGDTLGYELLLRLEDGQDPPCGPAEFLPAAERSDLVLAIDRWVLDQAIAALVSPAAPDLWFNVNVSGRTLEDQDFGDFVLDKLASSGVAPGRLGLEITETAAMTNLDAARSLALKLRSAGCRIALDDFGSGFGSFIHLKHLPITGLKIDGEFVRAIDSSTRDAVLVKGIMEIARGLGLSAVAEWVERPSQVDALIGLGVRVAQGYHLGKPRPLSNLLTRTGPSLTGAGADGI